MEKPLVVMRSLSTITEVVVPWGRISLVAIFLHERVDRRRAVSFFFFFLREIIAESAVIFGNFRFVPLFWYVLCVTDRGIMRMGKW